MSTVARTDEDPEPPDDNTSNGISLLKEAVLHRKPVLKVILSQYGEKALSDYISTYQQANQQTDDAQFNARKEEFIKVFEEEATSLLGPEVAKLAAEQLRHFYFVSTADHHGPVCAPDFVNSNLATAVNNSMNANPFLKNVIVLTCANVSLNNFSFPRGLVFHNFEKGNVNTHRLSFLPSNAHSSTVYNFRSYTPLEIIKIKGSLKEKVGNGSIQAKQADHLNSIFDEIYNQPEIFNCNNYSDQVTKTNFKLWKKFFADHDNCPNLVFLGQETIVSNLLIKHHLFNDTIVNHLLFDNSFSKLIEKYFGDDISATYMFWALPKDSKFRQKLVRDGHMLVSEDRKFQLELEPAAIAKALKNKELIPSLLLNFILLSFYYGVKCLGGPFQIHYLTKMKNSYLSLLNEANFRDSINLETYKNVSTDKLCCDFYLSFLGTPNKQLIPATGLDIILYNKGNLAEKLLKSARDFTLENALMPAMPEYYAAEYNKQERAPELANIQLSDILNLPILRNKIQPLAYL